jgi:hypothetical protein
MEMPDITQEEIDAAAVQNMVVQPLRDEIERLRRELEPLRQVERTARVYFDHYLQDEADDVDYCICGDEQHNRAKLLRGALKLAKA